MNIMMALIEKNKNNKKRVTRVSIPNKLKRYARNNNEAQQKAKLKAVQRRIEG